MVANYRIQKAALGLLLILIVGICLNCSENSDSYPPEILTITPMSATVGQTIAIWGKGFASGVFMVSIGGATTKATVINDQQLSVVIPPRASSGEVIVYTFSGEVSYHHPFTITETSAVTTHSLMIHRNGRVAYLLLSPPEFDAYCNTEKGISHSDGPLVSSLYADVYRKFRDNFDFVFEVHNKSRGIPAQPGLWGYAHVVSNSIKGIGLDTYDRSEVYGSEGKLKAILAGTFTGTLAKGPTLHEMMHVWGNYGIRSQTFNFEQNQAEDAGSHWGLAGCGGMLGGFDQVSLESNIDGDPNLYKLKMPDNVAYSNFELYLMGLIPADSLTPFDVFTEVVTFDGSLLLARKRTTYNRERIEKELGPRVPSYMNSPKHFTALVLMITMQPLTEAEFDTLDDEARLFFMPSDNGDALVNFWEAAKGKAQISVDHLHESIR